MRRLEKAQAGILADIVSAHKELMEAPHSRAVGDIVYRYSGLLAMSLDKSNIGVVITPRFLPKNTIPLNLRRMNTFEVAIAESRIRELSRGCKCE